MTLETPLLSLCIPTYNRASLLDQALCAILGQIGLEEAKQVEVIIVDNASPDYTAEIAEKAARKSPHISLHYVRNAENIGADANFLKSIELARGKFVYLLSDDDILLPGAILKLLEMIEQHPDYDAFSLNAASFSHRPEEGGAPWLNLAEDVTIWDRDEALKLVRGHITFMSMVAFNKSRIAERLVAQEYQSKVGTYFLQSYLFLDILSGGNGFLVTAQPMIAQRVENCLNLNYFRVFVTEMHALMMYAKQCGYSADIIQTHEAENLVGARHFIARVKIYGREIELWSSRRDAISRLFRVYRFRPYLWLAVIPLLFFPRFLRPLVFAARRMLGRPEISVGKG